MHDLILASASPRRRELLLQLGVRFEVLPTAIDETPAADESPESYVSRMALEKARATVARLDDQHNKPVLGADTAVVIDNQILGKPKDQEQALAMLGLLSGRQHQVISAVAVVQGERVEQSAVSTLVWFRELPQEEMMAYWQTGEPKDKAGAYGIQGYGAAFVTKLEGSYSAVVGLPLAETAALFNRLQIPIWQSA